MNALTPIQPSEINKPESMEECFNRFRDALAKVAEDTFACANILNEAIERYPGFENFIREQDPTISLRDLHTLKRIGRGELSPKLIGSNCAAYQAAGKLPIIDQERILQHGVELLLADGQSLLVTLESLSYAQVKQVFGRDVVRDLGGQRAWLEDQKSKASAILVNPAPYCIRGKTLIINSPCELDYDQIMHLAQKMGSGRK